MQSPSPGFHRHDHAHCVASALAAAEDTCAAKGLQLTPVRRRVLGDHEPALTVIIADIFDEAWLLEIEAIAVA